MKRQDPLARLAHDGGWCALVAVVVTAGCAALAGLDEDYRVGSPAGTSSGAAGSGNTTQAGTASGGSAAAGGSGATGGWAGSGGEGLTGALEPGDVQLYYGVGTSDTPLVRTWEAASRNWRAPEPTTAAGAVIRWVVTPETLRDPPIVGVLSDSGAARLDVLTRSTAGWTADWATTAIASANVLRRGFDIEYEDSSGDALVVYSDNTGNPKYRTLASGVWSAEQPVLIAETLGTVLWVELVARADTDELTLLFNNDVADLFFVPWDGSSWQAGTRIEDDHLTPDFLAFAAAYEGQSGDLLVVWSSPAGGASGFYSGSLSAESKAFSPHGLQPYPLTKPGPVRLRSDRATDRIALAYVEYTCNGDDCDDFTAAIWDGSSWTHQTILDPQIHQPYSARPGAMPIDLAWVGPDEVVAVYTENGSGLDWARWTSSTSWVLQDDWLTTPPLGARVNVQAFRVAGRNEALFLVSDEYQALYGKLYDGAGWLDLGGCLEPSLSSLGAVPFAAAMKR